jgi:hypothetical protein
MGLSYGEWLRKSNETADIRQAYEMFDQMTLSIGKSYRTEIFNAIYHEAERRWKERKEQYDTEDGN